MMMAGTLGTHYDGSHMAFDRMSTTHLHPILQKVGKVFRATYQALAVLRQEQG
jgi:hypothetical protein